jgi:hypothetical protein
MSPVTITGDLAGLVLLAIAIAVAARKAAGHRPGPALTPPRFDVGNAGTAGATTAVAGTSLATDTAASGPAAAVPARPTALATSATRPGIPVQARWQARSAGLIEDRVPGPASLQLEEPVGAGDQ